LKKIPIYIDISKIRNKPVEQLTRDEKDAIIQLLLQQMLPNLSPESLNLPEMAPIYSIPEHFTNDEINANNLTKVSGEV